jgi:hypothetical protein
MLCGMSDTIKPIVRYLTLHTFVDKGEPAVIVPVHHPIPVLNGKRIATRPVTDVVPCVNDSRPVFETEDYYYIPVNPS